MKKILIAALILAVIVTIFYGCNVTPTTSNQTNNNYATENVVSQTIVPKKETIVLNASNIKEYLIFSVSTSDVEKESINFNGMSKADGKATLKISPKQAGTFENVSLSITLKTNKEYGWSNKEIQVELPFDGKTENTYTIGSYIADYVSSRPSYEVVVTSASGKFVK